MQSSDVYNTFLKMFPVYIDLLIYHNTKYEFLMSIDVLCMFTNIKNIWQIVWTFTYKS